MTRIVKPEVAQDLTNLLPVLEPRSLSPDEVSATLQLVQPLLPGTHKHRLASARRVNGGVGSLTVADAIHADDTYDYVAAASVYNTGETVGHRHSILVNFGAGAFSVAVVTDSTAVIRTTTTTGLPLPRPMLIGPRSFLAGGTDTIEAGTALTLDISFVLLLILDPHPNF